jgi:hypothetical protein
LSYHHCCTEERQLLLYRFQVWAHNADLLPLFDFAGGPPFLIKKAVMQGQVCSQLVSAKIEREVGSYNDGKRIECISPGLLSYVCLEECPELESCMASSFQ